VLNLVRKGIKAKVGICAGKSKLIYLSIGQGLGSITKIWKVEE
jgi:hypothetical protein